MSPFVRLTTTLLILLLIISSHNAARLLLQSTNINCPQDVKSCPSGTTLIRDPITCEFPPCICGGFIDCKGYNDGCNSCRCGAQGIDACTKRACSITSTPTCIECDDGYTLNPNTGHCEQILIFCTQDIKTCPDGTFVSRNPLNNCEFDACVGDSCGIPGIDCIVPRCATGLCPDGVTCYGCGCDTCSYEYDTNGNLYCSGFIPQDRVCPITTTTASIIEGDPCEICEFSSVCASTLCAEGARCCDSGDGTAICCSFIETPNEESCGKEGKCYNIFTQQCSFVAPCAPREYCPTDTNSPFFQICNAYPEARCQFTGCGGCYEYFVDDYGNVIQDCEIDICALPLDIGPCDAIIPRVFYDANVGKCVAFEYGGCGGNANNFATRIECNQICKRADKLRK